jgi:glycosyl transferase, family 25
MEDQRRMDARYFWSGIDAVLVINLDQRPERWEAFLAQANEVIPTEKVHRISAVYGRALPGFGQPPWFRGRKRDNTWAARGGCTLSHRRALQTAQEAGWENVLVLEDDVAFQPELPPLLGPLGAALASEKFGWDVCYLGYTDPWAPACVVASLDWKHRLYRIFGCNCAHAYIIRPTARDWLLERMPDEGSIWPWLARHRAVDRWYRLSLGQRFRVLVVSPGPVVQSAGFSDIVGRPVDYVNGEEHRSRVSFTPSRRWFAPRLFGRIQQARISARYDRLRGLAKRLRGF